MTQAVRSDREMRRKRSRRGIAPAAERTSHHDMPGILPGKTRGRKPSENLPLQGLRAGSGDIPRSGRPLQTRGTTFRNPRLPVRGNALHGLKAPAGILSIPEKNSFSVQRSPSTGSCRPPQLPRRLSGRQKTENAPAIRTSCRFQQRTPPGVHSSDGNRPLSPRPPDDTRHISVAVFLERTRVRRMTRSSRTAVPFHDGALNFPTAKGRTSTHSPLPELTPKERRDLASLPVLFSSPSLLPECTAC